MTATGSQPRIFISYSHRSSDEAEFARRLHDEFAGLGYETFIDTRIIVGADWSREIASSIEKSDFFVVLLSENSAHSEMVQAEIRLAHNARRADGRPIIIPIRFHFDRRENASLLNEQKCHPERLHHALFTRDCL
jgi:TIR domain